MPGPSETGTLPLLNSFQPGDRAAPAELLNDPTIAEFTSIPSPYTLADADRWLSFVEQTTRKHGEPRQFAIRCDNELAGCFDFRQLEANDKAEIGYWLGSRFRGRGIMTEVVGAACRYARERWGLKRLEAFVYPHNQGSILVLERNGFSREGMLEGFYKRDDRLIDALQLSKAL